MATFEQAAPALPPLPRRQPMPFQILLPWLGAATFGMSVFILLPFHRAADPSLRTVMLLSGGFGLGNLLSPETWWLRWQQKRLFQWERRELQGGATDVPLLAPGTFLPRTRVRAILGGCQMMYLSGVFLGCSRLPTPLGGVLLAFGRFAFALSLLGALLFLRRRPGFLSFERDDLRIGTPTPFTGLAEVRIPWATVRAVTVERVRSGGFDAWPYRCSIVLDLGHGRSERLDPLDYRASPEQLTESLRWQAHAARDAGQEALTQRIKNGPSAW